MSGGILKEKKKDRSLVYEIFTFMYIYIFSIYLLELFFDIYIFLLIYLNIIGSFLNYLLFYLGWASR